MLDIETLGTKPGCVITQIACIPFTEEAVSSDSSWFRANVDITTFGHTFHIDAATLKWAIEKGVPILRPDAKPAAQVLADLYFFIQAKVLADKSLKIWAKSPSFDCEIIEAAWRRFEIATPWHYWQLLDVRTETWREPRDTAPAAHDATADCLSQISAIQKVWNARRSSLLSSVSRL